MACLEGPRRCFVLVRHQDSILYRAFVVLQSAGIEIGVSNVDVCAHPLAIANREPNKPVSLVITHAKIRSRDTYKYPNRAKIPEILLVVATPTVSMEGIISADTGASNSDRRALM